MQPTFSTTKWTPPNLPAVINRDRLSRRMRTCRSNGVMLILGQAAQGKTTLVAEFVRQTGAPTAWLVLDSADCEQGCFVHALVEACAPLATPSRDSGICCNEALPDVRANGTPSAVLERLQILWRQLPEQIQIVLDGLERLPDEAPAFDIIRFLCEASFDKGRIWLLSRRKPPFEYPQAVVNRQMLVLNNEDLAFTPGEIQIYYETIHRLELTPFCIEQIHRATEGWPGGLILIAQTLERMPAAQWSDYLSHDLPFRLYPETRDYFDQEIFKACPVFLKSLLLRAAILETFDAEMLAEITGIADCGNYLDRLIRNNTFIRAVYDSRKRRVLYRFNPLFREFLRVAFKTALSLSEQKELYARIGAYHEARNETAAALKWHFLADDFNSAATGLKRISTDLVIRGNLEELAERLDPFSEDQCQADPWLFFLRTLTGRFKSGTRCLQDLKSALERFSVQNDIRGQMLALAHLIEAGILLGQTPGPYLRWIEKAETWLISQSATPYHAWAKTLLWLYVGFAYIVSGFDLTKGISAAQNALVMARRMGNAVLTARAAIISGLGMVSVGETDRADEMLCKIPAQLDKGQLAEYGVLRDLVYMKMALRRGNFAAARKFSQALGRDIEARGLLFLYPIYLDASGFLSIYQGRYAEATATGRYLLDMAVLTSNPINKGMAYRLSSYISYTQANYSQSAAMARKALEELTHGGPDSLHIMRTRQLLALASIHLTDYGDAAAELGKVLSFFERTANPLSLAETYLIYALWANETGQSALAGKHLQNGFQIINGRCIERLVFITPEAVGHLCRLGIGLGLRLPECWRGLERIGGLATSEGNTPKVPDTLFAAAPGSTTASRPNTDLVVKTLGGFSVQHRGETISEVAWGGQRPKLLLKAILVRGLREIPKDLLIDDLWPQSNPDTALQNFKVTLHRLRRILQPGLRKGQSSAFIHLKGSLVSLDRDRCSVDLEQFLWTCKEIKRCALNGDVNPITALGRDMVALYQGDFLPEEPYAPWIEMKRWAIRDEYLDVLMKVARIHQHQRQTEAAVEYCRMILRMDDCHEAAAQLLIQLFTAQGRCNEARQVYNKLEHVLLTELGVPPEPATAALVRNSQIGETNAGTAAVHPKKSSPRKGHEQNPGNR